MVRLLVIAALILIPNSATGLTEGKIEAQFSRCASPKRVTCIVDGDTIWLHGTKIRIADINTPEITHAACPLERRLGERATIRMQTLLNRGPFELHSGTRDEDRYGRKLRIITRGGKSLGDVLVEEGLAEQWNGRRRNWC